MENFFNNLASVLISVVCLLLLLHCGGVLKNITKLGNELKKKYESNTSNQKNLKKEQNEDDNTNRRYQEVLHVNNPEIENKTEVRYVKTDNVMATKIFTRNSYDKTQITRPKRKVCILDNNGDEKLSTFEIPYMHDGETYLIGRSKTNNDLRLDDPTVSNKHAYITEESDGLYLYDNDSTNGTIYNGEKIKSIRLRDGMVITLGKTKIMFELAKEKGDKCA